MKFTEKCNVKKKSNGMLKKCDTLLLCVIHILSDVYTHVLSKNFGNEYKKLFSTAFFEITSPTAYNLNNGM